MPFEGVVIYDGRVLTLIELPPPFSLKTRRRAEKRLKLA